MSRSGCADLPTWPDSGAVEAAAPVWPDAGFAVPTGGADRTPATAKGSVLPPAPRSGRRATGPRSH